MVELVQLVHGQWTLVRLYTAVCSGDQDQEQDNLDSDDYTCTQLPMAVVVLRSEVTGEAVYYCQNMRLRVAASLLQTSLTKL